MPLFLALQELVPLLLHALQTFILQLEAIFVLVALILDTRVETSRHFARLLPSQVELLDGLFAHHPLPRLAKLTVVVVSLALRLELVLTLLLYLFNGPIQLLRLPLRVLLDLSKMQLRLDCRLVKLLDRLLLLALGCFHLDLQLGIAFGGTLQLLSLDFLNILLN